MGTPDTDFKLECPLDKAFEAYERRYRRHHEDIELDNSSWRMELRHRLDNFQQRAERLQPSSDALIDPFPVYTPQQRKSTRPRRKKWQSLVRLDFEALKYQLDELNRLTDELQSSDRRQEQAERSFDNVAASLATALRRSNAEVRPCIEKDFIERDLIEVQSDRTPQPPIAYELEAYYSAVSTLRNVAERIGELQSEQQEQRERRGVMEDQGQVLGQSEDDLLRHWTKTLSMAYQDFERAQGNVVFARKSCEHAGIAIPAWAEINRGEQQPFDDAGQMEGESQLLDGPGAELKHVIHWHESAKKGRFEHRGIWDGTSTLHTTPAFGPHRSGVRKTRPCDPYRLARLCLPLIVAAVPLVAARSNEVMIQDTLPIVTELAGSQSPRNDQNVVSRVLITGFQYALAVWPPLILTSTLR